MLVLGQNPSQSTNPKFLVSGVQIKTNIGPSTLRLRQTTDMSSKYMTGYLSGLLPDGINVCGALDPFFAAYGIIRMCRTKIIKQLDPQQFNARFKSDCWNLEI